MEYRCFRLTMDVLTLDVESQEKMETERKNAELWDEKQERFIFCFSEGGILNSTEERNRMLGAVLELMTNIIPLTPYSPPLIVIPGGLPPPQNSFLKEPKLIKDANEENKT